VTRWLARAFRSVTAADLEPDMIDFQSRAHGVTGFVAPIEPDLIAGHSQRYDVIWVFSLFSHLPEPRWSAWLAALGRLLRPRGQLIFSTHSYELMAKVNPKRFGDPSTWVDDFVFWEANETGGRLATSLYGCSVVTPAHVGRAVAAMQGFSVVRHYKKGEFDPYHDVWAIGRD
jgi:SAM-dependent methyltransferase